MLWNGVMNNNKLIIAAVAQAKPHTLELKL